MTPEEAERQLLERELFGMRFGLDRMRRLMQELGQPQRRFRSIHVVGTNGKSSTTRMIAAILSRHGLRVGSYLSPHLVSFNERIRVGEDDITPQQFAAAIERALVAAAHVERDAALEDRVTQFELLTAAGYWELARQEVEVAVIEAGLGGRYDATNVIPSSVQVLTGVGLEHTRWLGSTIESIAREKLDVVQPAATLLLGAAMHPDAVAVAREVSAQRGARIVFAQDDPHTPLGVRGLYQRRNFALARAAAAAFLGEAALDPAAVAAAALQVRVPGRMEIIDQRPLTVLDGAHNPDGMAALTQSLPALISETITAQSGGRVVAVVSILKDKDAAAMLAQLGAVCDALVLTVSRNPRVLSTAELLSIFNGLDPKPLISCEVVGDAHLALARARALAGEHGIALATGSLYLVAELARGPDDRPHPASMF
ncbi:MAG: bifunctional folylpolyglutamate synthase/dihydrofolate synthase [Solirubrobacteraceae bacterium]